MFEIVIDLLYIGRGMATEAAHHCFLAWKDGSDDTFVKVCRHETYDTLAACKADLIDAIYAFEDHFTVEQMRKERVLWHRVRCRSIGEKIT